MTATRSSGGRRGIAGLGVGRSIAALLIGTTLLRLALGWRYFGFLSGDDVEILETGTASGGGRRRARL